MNKEIKEKFQEKLDKFLFSLTEDEYKVWIWFNKQKIKEAQKELLDYTEQRMLERRACDGQMIFDEVDLKVLKTKLKED